MSYAAAMSAARHGNFDGVTRLLDVGGGSGCFPIALAQRCPEMSFTILDLPVTAQLAERYVAAFGLAHKIDTIALDMFHDPWPMGYDAVLFSNIVRAWDRKRCEYLAARSFALLPAGGRIYLHEVLLDDTKDTPLVATLCSMEMICWAEGKQFSVQELDVLLSDAGFTDIAVVNTFGYYSLVSARSRKHSIIRSQQD
jgi:cyclopropane fatty-acyl-phospholipid synthase-like methyltransferase